MSVNVEWLDENQNILNFKYFGRWTWDEVFEALGKSHELMDTVNYPVATIVDFTHSEGIPIDNMAHYMAKIAETRNSHPNDSGETVFVNAEVLTKAMLDIVQVTSPEVAKALKFTHAKSVNEAKDILMKII